MTGALFLACVAFLVVISSELVVTAFRRKRMDQSIADAFRKMIEPIAGDSAACPQCTSWRVNALGQCLSCGKLVSAWWAWLMWLWIASMCAGLLFLVTVCDVKPATRWSAIVVAVLGFLSPIVGYPVTRGLTRLRGGAAESKRTGP
jgi:hypothetical protein